jgi:TatD DNase family protein
MIWYDAHCHLANLALSYDINALLQQAEENGVCGWLSCALSKEEVRWHQLNRHDRLLFSAGIHPLYSEGSILTLDDLEALIQNKQLFALGEIGLDKRNQNLPLQTSRLKDQLALARQYNIPCVFHVVGHYAEFKKILSDLPVTGIWHGFYTSKDILKQFLGFDLTFSIGSVLVQSLKFEIINQIISYGNFLIETDAPYNNKRPEKNLMESLNPLLELKNYTQVVSRLNGIRIEALNRLLSINARQYFK